MLPQSIDEWNDRDKQKRFADEYIRVFVSKTANVQAAIGSIKTMSGGKTEFKSEPIPAGPTQLTFTIEFENEPPSDLKPRQVYVLSGRFEALGWTPNGLSLTLKHCKVLPAG